MTTEPLGGTAARASTTQGVARRHALVELPIVGGLLVVAVGLTVLCGWVLGVDGLKSMLPSAGTMKANTATCFVLMGGGVALMALNSPRLGGRRAGLLMVVAGSLIALATLAEYASGVNLGIDQPFFRDLSSRSGTGSPGRMSPLTAICFGLLGASATATLARPQVRRIAIPLAGAALAVAVLNVFDYMFNAAVPAVIAGYTQMAINTSVAMIVVAVTIVGLLGPSNPLAPLAGHSPTAVLLRRLLAVSIGAPVILAWFRLEGQRLGLYDTSYGTSLMLVGILVVSVTVILRSASWASRIDQERAALEIERDRFFDISLDLLSVTGTDGRFRRVNRSWERTLGYRPDELLGRRAVELVHPDDLDRTLEIARRHHQEGQSLVGFHNRYRHRNGSYRWLEWMSQTAPDGDLSFGVARDITERKIEEEQGARQQRALEMRNETLSERAVRDPLTGLHNRRFFDEAVPRLEQRWSRLSADQRGPVSVIIFDLDHFGAINKKHGHQAGDAVLRLFGDLIRKRFREGDLVARYGGEEFVAVLEGAPASAATRIAESIRAAFEEARIDIGTGTPIQVTVSAGCAELGINDDVAAGLSLADVWLAQAKRGGRNQVVGL